MRCPNQQLGAHLLELALGDAITVDHDRLWLDTVALLEELQEGLDVLVDVIDDLLAVASALDAARVLRQVPAQPLHSIARLSNDSAAVRFTKPATAVAAKL